MKIHIIGGSGSGKTYLAKRLADRYRLPVYELDDLFWDNAFGRYGVKMPAEKRDRLLRDILCTDDWIVEGAYCSWLTESFRQADVILVLEMPVRVCQSRIIRRFFKRKLGLEGGKRETLGSLIDLLRWTAAFEKNNLPEIHEMLAAYPDKTVTLHSRAEAERYIKCHCP